MRFSCLVVLLWSLAGFAQDDPRAEPFKMAVQLQYENVNLDDFDDSTDEVNLLIFNRVSKRTAFLFGVKRSIDVDATGFEVGFRSYAINHGVIRPFGQIQTGFTNFDAPNETFFYGLAAGFRLQLSRRVSLDLNAERSRQRDFELDFTTYEFGVSYHY